MTPGSTNGPTDYREYRRQRAYDLKEQGWKQRDIAAALGVTEGAVSQWLKRAREEGGRDSLRHRPPPGPTPRLTPEQCTRLREVLEQGAEAAGFEGNVWTSKRIVTLIRREFGVRYHRAHISRLVRTLGLSLQKPIVQASQRNEVAIERWRRERWPALKKGLAARDGRSSG
jgi:transposase